MMLALLLRLLLAQVLDAKPDVSLLVDPAVVSAAVDVVVVPGPVTKSQHNPLLKEDQPWEGAWWNTNPSVFFYNDSYHMYYTSNIVCSGRKAGMCPHSGWVGPPETVGPKTGLLFAQSSDGVQWSKPALGLYAAPPNNSKANNIVLASAALGNGVFFDSHANLFRQFGRNVCPQQLAAGSRHPAASQVRTFSDEWT